MSSTSVFYAFDYLIGLAVFSFIGGLLYFILPTFMAISTTGLIYNYACYMWTAAFFIYLIFGPFYFWNRLKEWEGPR